MDPLHDNRAEFICRVLARELLVIQKKAKKTGCKAGDTCLFPHYKIDEQQNRRLTKGHFPKRRKVKTKALWLSWKAWKHKCQSSSSANSYAPKFEDRSYEETERQQRCARIKAWNLAKIFTSSKKKTRLRPTHPRRSGYSRLRHQKSRRKESL